MTFQATPEKGRFLFEAVRVGKSTQLADANICAIAASRW
jgi:hypothetical protein